MADTQHGHTGQGPGFIVVDDAKLPSMVGGHILSYNKITLYNYICGWAYCEGGCTISRLQYVIERFDCAQHILYLFLSIMEAI